MIGYFSLYYNIGLYIQVDIGNSQMCFVLDKEIKLFKLKVLIYMSHLSPFILLFKTVYEY